MSLRNWMFTKLSNSGENEEIEKVTALGDCLIKLQHKEGKSVIIGVTESDIVTEEDVHIIYTGSHENPNMIVAKHGVVWTGSAINYCRSKNMGWGGMGNISSVFHTDNYGSIQKREYEFVEEGLLRHNKVLRLERLFDRKFEVHRTGQLSVITILLIDSYELSSDEIRNGINKYGGCDVILKTNPNGSPTRQAYSTASDLGAEICIWKELLGRLNKE